VFTESDGAYTVPNLAAGPYQLKVTLDGFTTYVQDGIVLQVGSNPQINAELKVGSVSEQIIVTANAAMVETRSTGVGQLIDNERVVELPLNGRQATELILLSGLATPAPAADLQTNKNYPTTTISVAGGAANGITYIMDGGSHNDPFNNLNLPTPFPDALQEFKVEASSLPARYGHHAAAAVNVITKSGTNQFHGAGFDFVRHYAFNEKPYFALEKDSLRRQQFGGTVGGPIARDRVFFFGAYQGKIEKTKPTTAQRFVPTDAMRAGDFTAFASAACNSGRAATLRAPFNNNRVEPALFSPAAVKLLQYVPTTQDPCGLYQFGIPNDNTEHQALGKVDYKISDAHAVFGRYLFAVYDNPPYFDGKNALTLSRIGQRNVVHSAVFGHNWILSANRLNAVHVSISRTFNDRILKGYFSPKDLGINVYTTLSGYANVSVQGSGFSMGTGATNPGFFNSTSLQLADDFDLINGSHELAFGENWIHTTDLTEFYRFVNGENVFNGTNIGLPLADFMLGRSVSFTQNPPSRTNQLLNYVALYAQDVWRLHPRFTMNYGVRWEPFLPMSNRDGRVFLFDMARFDAGIKSQVFPKAPAGLYFPGDDGYPGTSVTSRKLLQFAPRVGAIWQPSSDTTLRGAWGTFYDTSHLFYNIGYQGFGQGVAIPNPAGGLDDPYRDYPGGNPYPQAFDFTSTSIFQQFSGYATYPLHTNPTTLQQWNVTLQHQAGPWLFGASYLGSHTAHVWGGRALNPAVYIPGQSTTGNVNDRRVLVLRNPVENRLIGPLSLLTDTGTADYAGMLLSAERRLNGSFSVLTNWTLSKCESDQTDTQFSSTTTGVDPLHPEYDRGPCVSDRRHVVNVSGVIRTPELVRWGVLGHALSDWQFSPLVRWASGNWSTPVTNVDTALTGQLDQRALQMLADPYSAATIERRPDGSPSAVVYFNRDAFASPAPGTYSTAHPRSILNPSALTNDLAVTRRIPVASGREFQLRWEIFNVLNHVNYGPPIVTLNSSNFGRITTTGDPRIMQFAVKYAF
jgi:TonB-dependent receptor-like protein/carboxypeptidase family protein